MAVDAEDLIIQPFKELVQRGKEAIKSAQDAQDAHHDGISVETTNQMLKSANGVVKEGERALQKLYPLWASQLERYGEAFLEAINNNGLYSFGLSNSLIEAY